MSAASAFPRRLPPREQLVDLRQAVAHGVLRQPLQVQIERRVHIDRLRSCVVVRPGILLGERLADEVDEVRRFGFERALDDDERLVRRRASATSCVDVAGVGHRLQHDVAPLLAALRVVERRQRRRRLDDAGDRRRFGERDVADVLAEEQPRRFRRRRRCANDPRWPSGMSFRYISRISSFDARVVMISDDPHLEQLAPERLLARVLQRHPLEIFGRKTLRTTCCVIVLRAGGVGALAADVARRARRRCRSDRCRDARRSGDPRSRAPPASCASGIARERHRPPLLALAADERGQHRRVERQPLARPSCRARAAARDRAAAAAAPSAPRRRSRVGRRRPLKHDADDWPLNSGARGMIAIAPLPIANSPGFSSVLALRVAEVVQPIDELAVGQRLAAPQLERPGEARAEARVSRSPCEPRVDQPREADVVVGGGEAQEDRRNRERQRGEAHPALAPDRRDANSQAQSSNGSATQLGSSCDRDLVVPGSRYRSRSAGPLTRQSRTESPRS